MLLFLKYTDAGFNELSQALVINPKFVPAIRNLGVLYAYRGDIGKAIEEWKNAILLNPYDVETLLNYGVYMVEQNRNARGMEYLRKAYALAPTNSKVVEGYKYARSILAR
jgi:Tfp pilus assembly protein PilF